MDDAAYQKLADYTFRRLEDLLADVDAEDVDVERAGDVLTLTFKNRVKCVINTQRPTHQIWLAAAAHAWHFSHDGKDWKDDRDSDNELFAIVTRIVKQQSGLELGSRA